jgi:hypothetical protein
MLSYKAPSKTLAIVENAGGILRNISSHVAVREDYRYGSTAKRQYGKRMNCVTRGLQILCMLCPCYRVGAKTLCKLQINFTLLSG